MTIDKFMQCPRLSQYGQGIVTYRQGFEKQGFFGIFWEILRFFARFLGEMGQFLGKSGGANLDSAKVISRA